MKKIFIDGGGHDGCSIRMFNDVRQDANEFEKYSFEPNPKFKKFYDNLGTTLISKAIHVYNGVCNFYMQTSYVSAGSSVDKRKKNLSKWEQLEIPCIDLIYWMKENFSKDDFIILRNHPLNHINSEILKFWYISMLWISLNLLIDSQMNTPLLSIIYQSNTKSISTALIVVLFELLTTVPNQDISSVMIVIIHSPYSKILYSIDQRLI